MNANRLKNRLRKLEDGFFPPDDGTFTLEELCRTMWQASKDDFLNLARETCLGFFIAQFEREDSEHNQPARRGRAKGDRR